jgi:hypothetical protein
LKAENHFSPTPTPTATPVRHVAFHAPRFLRNTLVQRAIYYVSTGAVCLAVLLFIAKSLNPPDSALMGADLVARIGRWDGHWKGAETTYTPKGQKVATAAVELSLWSTSANMQMARVTRKETSGSQATETWVTTVDGPGLHHHAARGGGLWRQPPSSDASRTDASSGTAAPARRPRPARAGSSATRSTCRPSLSPPIPPLNRL